MALALTSEVFRCAANCVLPVGNRCDSAGLRDYCVMSVVYSVGCKSQTARGACVYDMKGLACYRRVRRDDTIWQWAWCLRDSDTGIENH